MKIYALVGPSGTGKSTIALLYSYNYQIPAIIDDGLLIYEGKKVAGSSAKYEKNYITAVKRAIFFYENHREEVSKEIELLLLDKILLIGTSTKMVNIIAERLKLGSIDKYVNIQDVQPS